MPNLIVLGLMGLYGYFQVPKVGHEKITSYTESDDTIKEFQIYPETQLQGLVVKMWVSNEEYETLKTRTKFSLGSSAKPTTKQIADTFCEHFAVGLSYYAHSSKSQDGWTPVTTFPLVKCEYNQHHASLQEHEFRISSINRKAAEDAIPQISVRDLDRLYKYK